MLLNCGVGKDSWESLGRKEIQPAHPKGDQSWMFVGRTDAEAETPILRPPDVKNWLIRKDPDAGKNWRWEEKGMTENEMAGWHHQLNGYEFGWTPGVADGWETWHAAVHGVSRSRTWLRNWTELVLGKIEGGRQRGWQEMVGWHHWLNGHEFEQALGDSEGRESLVCCSPWGIKEPVKTEWLQNNNNVYEHLLSPSKSHDQAQLQEAVTSTSQLHRKRGKEFVVYFVVYHRETVNK